MNTKQAFNFRATLVAAFTVATVVAHAAWFTSESAFLAAIQPTYYVEDFSGFGYHNPLDGTQTTWAAPGGNGYGWTASCANGLVSNSGSLSTLAGPEPLKITFTGAPVSAFGGWLANTDNDGVMIPGTITMALSDGTTQSITFSSPLTSFLGWAGPQTITSVTLSAVSSLPDPPQITHAITGFTPTPEPVTTALGLFGAVAMVRRKLRAEKISSHS